MNSFSIPPNWPLSGLSIFDYKYRDHIKCLDVYRLSTSKLSDQECHMFFPAAAPCEELLIATYLEFVTFHPSNKVMNDKFNICPVKCGSVDLFWCRFPLEFKDVCDRASKVFGMTMKIMPRLMILTGPHGTGLEFPASNNILCFAGERCHDPKKISRECEWITQMGDVLESLGVD